VLTIAVAAGAVAIIGGVTAGVRASGSTAAGTGAHAKPQGWVQVVDRVVGFSAPLPARPTDSRLAPRLGDGTQLWVRVARASHRIVIERIASPDVSPAEVAQIFRAAVDSLAWGAGFQVESQSATSFRGRPAHEGLYVTDTGAYYRALMFIDTRSDLCLIAAPARVFDQITASFQSIPPHGA
jgi:hypothetical protein